MERVCFLGRVRPERLEEYRARDSGGSARSSTWADQPGREANWKWR